MRLWCLIFLALAAAAAALGMPIAAMLLVAASAFNFVIALTLFAIEMVIRAAHSD